MGKTNNAKARQEDVSSGHEKSRNGPQKNPPRLGFPRARTSPVPADATSRWFCSRIRRRRRKEGAGGSVHARRTGIRCPSTTRPCPATSIASRGHVSSEAPPPLSLNGSPSLPLDFLPRIHGGGSLCWVRVLSSIGRIGRKRRANSTCSVDTVSLP
jgi:hypothetical protein